MSFSEFFKRFLVVLFVLVLCVGIWAARYTLLLGFAAAMLAVGINIPAVWLQRAGLRRAWAVTGATLAVGIVTIILAFLILPRLLDELVTLSRSIPEAMDGLAVAYGEIRRSSRFLEAALPELPSVNAGEIDPESAQTLLNQLVNASLAIAPSLLGGVNVLVAVLVNLALVLFIAMFFLVDPQSYVKGSLFLVPARYHDRMLEIWRELYLTIKQWIVTLLVSIAITASLVWLILGVLLGMPNAMIVAVFAGIATFVPNIGAFLPLIPIVIFTLASDNPAQLAIMAPTYLTIQLIESNVIAPSIVKVGLNIPSGALILFQVLVTFAFGALGLFLAVPMFAVLIVLVREIYSYDILGLRDVRPILHTQQADTEQISPTSPIGDDSDDPINDAERSTALTTEHGSSH